jgi:hypothetical protein
MRAPKENDMSAKKLALSWLVVFICVSVLNFLIHGILLSPDYQSFPQLMRPPIEGPKYMPYMFFAFAVFALAMVWIYAQGAKPESPWLGQGIRFGIAVWALTSIPMYLIYYSVQPWPLGITLKQIGFEFVSVVIYGIVTAALYGKRTGQARASTAGN